MLHSIEKKKSLMQLKSNYLEVLMVIVRIMDSLPEDYSSEFLTQNYEYFSGMVKKLDAEIAEADKTSKFVPFRKVKREIQKVAGQFKPRSIVPDGVEIPQGIDDLV